MKRELLLGALLMASLTTEAAIIEFTGTMDCAAANAGNGTCDLGGSGTGSIFATLDDVTNAFDWEVSWSGLSGDVTVAHFHGPATVNQNNGPQITIDVSQNPSIGNTILTDAQEADLLAGLWYVNVHSTTFGPGEIRGQVLAANPVPVPAAAWLLASGILGLASFRRR